MSTQGFTIQPVQWADIPTLAKIGAAAFERDSHSEMKSHGQKPYNHEESGLQFLPAYLGNPKIAMIKAVEDGTGDTMGVCAWGFRGFPPPFAPPQRPEAPAAKPEETPETQSSTSDPLAESKPEPEPDRAAADSVARLEAMTSADLDAFMKRAMPEGAKCMFICSLSVAPRFQRRGVGRALLKWGTDILDREGLYAWVHSSEDAWPMYEKAGFKIVHMLDVDLDEWAPVPAPAERYKDGKWGHYVFRYMVYGPIPEWLKEPSAE